ncbi:MAG TPA: hypothetical protein VG839_05930 [Asticcacaulis sp.]|nr:hypothetical protein [Asticcacaulis sp.]
MLLFTLLAAADALPAAYPDPLGPAATGQAQCYVPDTARKTCISMAYYKARGDGTFDNTAVVMLSKSPVVIMQTVTPATVADGAVCGKIEADQIAAATLTVNGQALSPADAAPMLAKLSAAMKGVYGKQICTRYVSEGGQLTAKTTMDGAPQPDDQKVIWVSPGDGYHVAP